MHTVTDTPISDALLHRLMRQTPGQAVEENSTDDSEERQRIAIAQAMHGLSSEERDVLNLRFLDGEQSGFSYEEIAQDMGIRVETARQLEVEALAKLQHILPPSREAIAPSATRQYVPIMKPVSSAPQYRPAPGTKSTPFGPKIDREPIFAYLNAHPNVFTAEIARKFHISDTSAKNICAEWRKGKKSATPTQAKLRPMTQEEAHAFALAHPTCSAAELAFAAHVSRSTIQTWRRLWAVRNSTTTDQPTPAASPITPALPVEQTIPIPRIESERLSPMPQISFTLPKSPPAAYDAIVEEARALAADDADAVQEMQLASMLDIIAFKARRFRGKTPDERHGRSELLDLMNWCNFAIQAIDTKEVQQGIQHDPQAVAEG